MTLVPGPMAAVLTVPVGDAVTVRATLLANAEALSPILSPLEPVKQNVCVVTNTELQNAYPATHSSSSRRECRSMRPSWPPRATPAFL